MNIRKLEDLLKRVKSGEMTLDEAIMQLKSLPFEDLGFTRIDHHRSLRKGFPEVIWGEGKTSGQILSIMKQLKKKGQNILITRLEGKKAKAVQKVFLKSRYYPKSKVLTYLTHPVKSEGKGTILVITAGTTDIPVAEEARGIAEEMGCTVFAAYDLGVAGIHRVMQPLKELIMKDVDVIIVVAGREGALCSVVAGMVDVPVVAVPTSNSYGFGEKGVSTLMAMLQSCSLGSAVVNIDSGVAAGAMATLIANRVAKFRNSA